MTVLSTTRNPGKAKAVTGAGADHVLIDDGDVAQQVRQILPGGADTALTGQPTQTPNLVGDPYPSNQNVNSWLNPAAFAVPSPVSARSLRALECLGILRRYLFHREEW